MHTHTNSLAAETSPYLLLHSHNPVDWYPWGNEALQKAKAENKLILVSIGYTACHWCHVMEQESFMDEQTAQIMNSNFINIKVDREERPDIDQVFMDAVQVINGGGGWPLNVFLTPDGKPFAGGTYFPPTNIYNRPSWRSVLIMLANSFQTEPDSIYKQADTLAIHLQKLTDGVFEKFSRTKLSPVNDISTIATNLLSHADSEFGGFGAAPKFPQFCAIQYLLRYHYVEKKSAQNQGLATEALQHALFSIDKLMEGGIYDQLGGGLCRYSTDEEWLAPHFEKMLYDNALFILSLADAFLITRHEKYKQTLHQTMQFLQRELMSVEDGFYASLDADSEGEEGKFYTFDRAEVEKLLGEDAEVYCEFYDITYQGNWEGKNILRILVSIEKFAIEQDIAIGQLSKLLESSNEKLFNYRKARIPPALDDKILLGWNALMNRACSSAFAATGHEAYKNMAVDNMNFLLSKFINPDGGYYHTYKNGQAKIPAFLDDYAFFISALIDLYQITADEQYLSTAKDLTSYVVENFSDNQSALLNYVATKHQEQGINKKEIYDGATPCSNAVMAINFYHLSLLFDNVQWREKASRMLLQLGNMPVLYPQSFGKWAVLMLEMLSQVVEVSIIGSNYPTLQSELLNNFIPFKLLKCSSNVKESIMASIRNYSDGLEAAVYICKNFSCFNPVTTINEAIDLINESNSTNNFGTIQ